MFTSVCDRLENWRLVKGGCTRFSLTHTHTRIYQLQLQTTITAYTSIEKEEQTQQASDAEKLKH